MKKKNTRDYGKPRANYARGGRVREPGLTDHLQTGPSWWPDEWSTDMHPSKKVLQQRKEAAENPMQGVNEAIQLAREMQRQETARRERVAKSSEPADRAAVAAARLTNPVGAPDPYPGSAPDSE